MLLSLMRGWVMPQRFAAAACVQPLSWVSEAILRINSARTLRLAASSAVSASASQTRANRAEVFSVADVQAAALRFSRGAVASVFRGRPPSLPFARAATFLALVVAWPPLRPRSAIHALVPKMPSMSAGR